jgi:hypothetical protein
MLKNPFYRPDTNREPRCARRSDTPTRAGSLADASVDPTRARVRRLAEASLDPTEANSG